MVVKENSACRRYGEEDGNMHPSVFRSQHVLEPSLLKRQCGGGPSDPLFDPFLKSFGIPSPFPIDPYSLTPTKKWKRKYLVTISSSLFLTFFLLST